MLIKNKDLNLILESFLRAARHHSGDVPVTAFVMTPEGKVTRMSGRTSHDNGSATEKIRYLEVGISTLVREGKCKAVGLPLEGGLFLEHQDRSAFLVHFSSEGIAPERTSVARGVPTPAEPRFFVIPRLVDLRQSFVRLLPYE